MINADIIILPEA